MCVCVCVCVCVLYERYWRGLTYGMRGRGCVCVCVCVFCMRGTGGD